jgi:hypothetical protein
MRYRATADNLVLEVPPFELEQWVRRVVALLVPRYTSKVYLMTDSDNRFNGIEHPGLAVVQPGQEPSNFLQSFRLILRAGELIVVSSRERRFGREEWRSFAEELGPNAT